jgi:hypothetical protein
MRAQIVSLSDVARCPMMILSPAHYRDDGSCRCHTWDERGRCVRCGERCSGRRS